MASFNRVIIIGNLTRDPEYKQLTSGQAVCRLGIASNRQFKNRQSGDMVQEVCYIDIDVWGPQAESCRQYLQKGRPVLCEGRIKFDSWQDTNGQARSKHSIVADRVVFLASNAQQTETDDVRADSGNPRLDPNNPLEKELIDQIDQIKNRTQVRAATKPKTDKKPAFKKDEGLGTSGGELDFKDEPPFQDDLPF